MTAHRRLVLAFAVLALWILAAMALLPARHGPSGIAQLVQHSWLWGAMLDAVLLVAAALLLRWGDLGLQAPSPRRLYLAWPVLLYPACLLLMAALTRPLDSAGVAHVVGNTLIVGFSEELMFRGVLWGAARRAMRFWPAALLVSTLFGAAHVVNVLVTGNFTFAAVQAVNAACLGFALLALRVRMRSVLPVMAVHALWDMSILLVEAGTTPAGTSAPWSSCLLILPLPLYGLWLLRRPEFRLVED